MKITHVALNFHPIFIPLNLWQKYDPNPFANNFSMDGIFASDNAFIVTHRYLAFR
jgi:hypothetical protein